MPRSECFYRRSRIPSVTGRAPFPRASVDLSCSYGSQNLQRLLQHLAARSTLYFRFFFGWGIIAATRYPWIAGAGVLPHKEI